MTIKKPSNPPGESVCSNIKRFAKITPSSDPKQTKSPIDTSLDLDEDSILTKIAE